MKSSPAPADRYQIRFQSLKDEGMALEFPCDVDGRVELEALSDRNPNDSLFAPAVVGCEFGRPAVVPAGLR